MAADDRAQCGDRPPAGAPAVRTTRCRGGRLVDGPDARGAGGPPIRSPTTRRVARDAGAASARVDCDEVRRRYDEPRHCPRHRTEREQRWNHSAPRGRNAARALVRRGHMTSDKMSTDKVSTMHHDAWLHALRSTPSPLFKAELRERLRAQEPAADTRRDWPRRALIVAAIVVVILGLISVPVVRASVVQFVSLFRVINLVAVPIDSSRIDRLKAKDLEIGTLIGEHVQVVEDPGAPVNFKSLADAAAAADMTLATPEW